MKIFQNIGRLLLSSQIMNLVYLLFTINRT